MQSPDSRTGGDPSLPPIPDSECIFDKRKWAESLDPKDANGVDWEGEEVYGVPCKVCQFVPIIVIIDWIMAFFLMRLSGHQDFTFKMLPDRKIVVYRRSRVVEDRHCHEVRIDFAHFLDIIGKMEGVPADEEHNIPEQPAHDFEYHVPFSYKGGRWRLLNVERMARGDTNRDDIDGIEWEVFSIINRFMDTSYHVDGDQGCHACVLNACYADEGFKDKVFDTLLAKMRSPSSEYTRRTPSIVNARLSRDRWQ